jgi:hypothetical protein
MLNNSLLRVINYKVLVFCLIILNSKLYSQVYSGITNFNSGPCNELFYSKDKIWKPEIVGGNKFVLNFTYEMECAPYLFPQLIKITNDTLKIQLLPSEKKWHKDAAISAAKIKEDFRGFYNISFEIPEISQIPKEIVINNEYYHNYFGFIDVDLYRKVKGRVFNNNSQSIIYDDALKLIGEQINGSDFSLFSKKIGEDYIIYDDEYGKGKRYNFLEDHIVVFVDNKSTVYKVSFDLEYNGTLPGEIKMSSDFNSVKQQLGDPDKVVPNYAELVDMDGKRIRTIIKSYNYYYKKYKFTLEYDDSGYMISCSFGT